MTDKRDYFKPLKFLRLVTSTNKLDLTNLILITFTFKMLFSTNPQWAALGAIVAGLIEAHKRYNNYLSQKNVTSIDELKKSYDAKLQEMNGRISNLQLQKNISGAPVIAKPASAGKPAGMPNLNQYPKGM